MAQCGWLDLDLKFLKKSIYVYQTESVWLIVFSDLFGSSEGILPSKFSPQKTFLPGVDVVSNIFKAVVFSSILLKWATHTVVLLGSVELSLCCRTSLLRLRNFYTKSFSRKPFFGRKHSRAVEFERDIYFPLLDLLGLSLQLLIRVILRYVLDLVVISLSERPLI